MLDYKAGILVLNKKSLFWRISVNTFNLNTSTENKSQPFDAVSQIKASVSAEKSLTIENTKRVRNKEPVNPF